MNLAPSWICRGPPNRAVDGALVGSRARTFGKKPVGHVMLSGFAVSARAELPVQKLLIESTPKPLLVFLVTLKTSADRSSCAYSRQLIRVDRRSFVPRLPMFEMNADS